MSRLHETADSEKKKPGIWWKIHNSWTKTMNGFFSVDIFSKISSIFDDVEISDDEMKVTILLNKFSSMFIVYVSHYSQDAR